MSDVIVVVDPQLNESPPCIRVLAYNGPANGVTIFRHGDDGSVEQVRPLIWGGQTIVLDYEAPQGVRVVYEAYGATSNPTAMPTLGTWLIHPAKPELSTLVTVAQDDTRTGTMPDEVIRVPGRRSPLIITTGPRSLDSGTLSFRTYDDRQRKALLEVLSDGSPLLLSSAPHMDLPRWVHFGDVQRSRRWQYCGDATREWSLPFVEIDRPDVVMPTRPTRIRDVDRAIVSLSGVIGQPFNA